VSLSVGARIGPYEVTALIGEGGMGQVYRATDTNLKRAVAIKVLPESVAADRERLARFQREAEVLASLNHPNIAQIYGLEKADGILALVMELVEGPTLADRIAQGPIPVDEALPIAKQMAEALEAAHEQNIIHRDLKPANVKLRPDGVVKVLDFGLAKALEPASGVSVNATASPTITSPAMMTGVGVLLGTAAYMSPEQARGRTVNKRCDIWAFGCVLYEMLTGQRAFAGEDVTDTLAAVVRAEPAWDLLPADVPPGVQAFLRRCLQKNAKQRLHDIADMRIAIEGGFETASAGPAALPLPAPAAPPLWKRWLPVGAALVVGLAVGAFALWRSLSDDAAAASVARFAILLGEDQRFTNPGRHVLALSPDGTQMVYVANLRLFLRPMSNLEARPIPGTEGFPATPGLTSPAFAPNGNSIVFYAAGALKKIATTGGVAVTLCEADNPRGVSWFGETILFGQSEKGVWRVSANGGRPDQVVALEPGESAQGPQLLPDGETVLFTLGSIEDIASGGANVRVVAQSWKSGERKTLVESGSDGRYLSTGHLVYVSAGVLFAVPFDVDRLAPVGAPTPILEGVQMGGSSAQAAISDTGTLAYVPGPTGIGTQQGRWRIARFDRRGNVEPLKIEPGTFVQPRVSPDGKQLAFGSDDSKEAIVWIYDLTGTTAPRRLTFEGRNRFPVWSADSKRVAFQSDREGDVGIFLQSADGRGTAERLTKPEKGTAHIPESWSPDNTQLLYNSNTNGMTALWVLSVADRKTMPFGNVKSPATTLTGAVFSPDGRWVAYASREGRLASAVFVEPFPPTGTRYQVSQNNDNGHHPVWTPDGTELGFMPNTGGVVFVSVVTQPGFAFGREVLLPGRYLRLPANRERPYDVSHDGQHFFGLVAPDNSDLGSLGLPEGEIRVVFNFFDELRRLVPTN
jgi:serine/threonine-protein kinase